MERGEGQFGLSQEEKTILIGRKDGDIEWQEVERWACQSGLHWMCVGGCIGKEEGVLDSYKSGTAIGPRLSCTQC